MPTILPSLLVNGPLLLTGGCPPRQCLARQWVDGSKSRAASLAALVVEFLKVLRTEGIFYCIESLAGQAQAVTLCSKNNGCVALNSEMTANIPGVLDVVRSAMYGVGYIIWQVGASSGIRNPNLRRFLVSRWLSYMVIYKQLYMMQGLMTQY